MNYKSCMTCRYFEDNQYYEVKNKEDYDRKVIEFSSSICYHTEAENKSTDEMIFRGPCGRDRRLWKQKIYYDLIEGTD